MGIVGKRCVLLLTSCLTILPQAARAALPEGVEQMLRTAAQTDAETLETAVDLALAAYPALAHDIASLLVALKAERRTATLDKRRRAAGSLIAGWSGTAEAGASLSTGNSDEAAVVLGFSLAKRTVDWRHVLTGTADFQRANGQTTSERFTLGYDTSYFFSDRLFMAAVLGWERDIFAGYAHRFTETLNLGYVAIDGETARLELEGGPGLRQTRTNPVGDTPTVWEDSVIGRAAARFAWDIADDTSFSQTLRLLAGGESLTLEGVSTLSVRLTDRLSGNVSLTARNEGAPAAGREGTDTMTRATLSYSF